MTIESDGLVIKEQKIGETDKLITVLTSQYGLIRAFVRRAVSVKSSMLSSTQLLSYSDFVFYKGKNSYTVNSASPKHSFFKLGDDVDGMAVGFYLAELFGALAPENEEAGDLLRLLLNSLYLLSERKRSPAFVKATAELRAMSDAGYMPDLVACAECGTYETEPMYFDPESGRLLCAEHGEGSSGYRMTLGAVTAMRYIIYGEPKKIFNYRVSDTAGRELARAAEQFVLRQTGREFRTLEFYKSLPKG